MERLSFERRKLLIRTAESLSVAYDGLTAMTPEEVQEFIGNGDVTLAALAYVTGFEESEIINEVMKQVRKGKK